MRCRREGYSPPARRVKAAQKIGIDLDTGLMSIAVDAVNFDCHDWRLVSTFWKEFVGYRDDPDAASYSDPGAGIMIIGPEGTTRWCSSTSSGHRCPPRH